MGLEVRNQQTARLKDNSPIVHHCRWIWSKMWMLLGPSGCPNEDVAPPRCWKHGHDPGSPNLEGGQRQQGLGESFNASPGRACFGWLIVQVKHQLKRATKKKPGRCWRTCFGCCRRWSLRILWAWRRSWRHDVTSSPAPSNIHHFCLQALWTQCSAGQNDALTEKLAEVPAFFRNEDKSKCTKSDVLYEYVCIIESSISVIKPMFFKMMVFRCQLLRGDDSRNWDVFQSSTWALCRVSKRWRTSLKQS